MGRSFTNTSQRLLLLVAVAMMASATSALAQIVFDGSPGTNAPPATLGGFTMTQFPVDPQPCGATFGVVSPGPVGSAIAFAPSAQHRKIGVIGTCGWGTWSHGYNRDVYFTPTQTITITLPVNTRAFYFYAQPNNFNGTYGVEATTTDFQTSGEIQVAGNAGAKYFGFYETAIGDLKTVTITVYPNGGGSSEGFAIGEFGINIGEGPLPVEMSYYNASQGNGAVNLEWATASETDNAGFELLRAEGSGDEHTPFAPIASYLMDQSLAGLGTSATGRTYSFSDNVASAAEGTRYIYKLVDVSITGERTDRGNIHVKIDPRRNGPSDPVAFRLTSVAPNPASNQVGIEFTLTERSNVTVEVVDASGRLVATPIAARTLAAGSHIQNFATGDLAAGNYTVVLRNGSSRRTTKLVVVR